MHTSCADVVGVKPGEQYAVLGAIAVQRRKCGFFNDIAPPWRWACVPTPTRRLTF